ncbi:MAG: multidrug DMT transporter permease, partial [Acidobacteria bacterium]|nr:multidrug DMT transporter permease [Acidobacteriota bacterium]
DIAGMAVAFPVGVGLALVMGVVVNYFAAPVGNPLFLFAGVAAVVLAMIIDALAYGSLQTASKRTSQRGVVLAVVAGVAMGLFYRFVAASMASDFANPEPGRLGPYTAIVVFAVGLFLSSFVWNSLVMAKPFVGPPVPFRDYFAKGDARLHAIGVLGGAIWGVGMASSIIASGPAGFAISYGLGQGATMVAALWGVLVWREFDAASPTTKRWLGVMFGCFVAGLALIIVSRVS